ncbi:MAG: hypothetical protein JOZ48_02115 [Acidobacteriaceae bacterium]|nr:hypothetical protein [Acidobacteriaceae bacterium]
MNRINLTSPVPPGAKAVFTFTVTDPNAVGTFPFQWGMVQDGVGWFGPLTPLVSYTNECDAQNHCR